MFMCLCYSVSNHEIKTLVQDGASTVEDIQQHCGAGMGCGCCLEALQCLIEKENATVLAQETRSSPHAATGNARSTGDVAG